ncbi:hypothetical protein LUW77_28180 [Streptomyces radiopugnans]|nr:hypothetical protein LUW77_28180 [Streptomyces radiopugnans]
MAVGSDRPAPGPVAAGRTRPGRLRRPGEHPRAAQANEVVMGIVLVVLALMSMLLLFRARRMSPEEAR